MANQMYNYGSNYGGAGVSSSYSGRPNAATDRYADASLLGSSRYRSSLDPTSAAFERAAPSFYSAHNDALRFSGAGAAYPVPSWAGVDGFGAADPASAHGFKRSAEALYHQTVLGTHNTIGQSEALFSANPLEKRPRIEIPSNLPIYPERPGEKDCAHYMLTRTCKFGLNCKFDHPRWVPEGGIPDWKEIPLIHSTEGLPERPGELDCPYFMKTQRCKFGSRCIFNHPKNITNVSAAGEDEEVEAPLAGQSVTSAEQTETALMDNGVAAGDSNPAKPFVPFTPASMHNSKGLPIRSGEPDCPFYLKMGSCKFGATCRYNHPERASALGQVNPQVAATLGQGFVPSPVTNLPLGVLNSAASFLQNIVPQLTQTTMSATPTIYPQRPGLVECDFYMKTGACKFGERCKFHHPIDRSAPTSEQNVKLTLAGLPRREGTVVCPYYMKTGACKYGVNCRFDHPPPGEAIAMAAVQGIGVGTEAPAAVGGDEENGADLAPPVLQE